MVRPNGGAKRNGWAILAVLSAFIGTISFDSTPAHAFDPWDRCSYAKTAQQKFVCADPELHAGQRELDRLLVAARSSHRARMESDMYVSPFGGGRYNAQQPRTIAHEMEDDFYLTLPSCGLTKACIRERQLRMMKIVSVQFSVF